MAGDRDLDIYCERVGEGLWAEPLNLLTNIAFIAAAVSLTRHCLARGSVRTVGWDIWVLIAVIGLIGLGSGAWHAFAAPWSLLLDVVPIGVFVSLYLVSFLRRLVGLDGWRTAAVFGLFQAVNVGAGWVLPGDLLNGSVMYLPVMGALLIMAGYLLSRGSTAARPFVTGTALFAVSLTLRSLDMALCAALPIGTHFLWHLLNAEVLRRMVLSLLLAAPRVGRQCKAGPVA